MEQENLTVRLQLKFMNKINIEPKTIIISPERVVTIAERKVNLSSVQWTTNDDSFAKRLQIHINGQLGFMIEGDEYDALGQWTDDDIAGLIIGKYGFKQI
jgi:hypothetical protein